MNDRSTDLSGVHLFSTMLKRWCDSKEVVFKGLEEKKTKGQYKEVHKEVQEHLASICKVGYSKITITKEALAELRQDAARLVLMQGKALHAKAGTLLEQEKLHALRKAYDAATKSARICTETSLCENQPMNKSQILAESLVLAANVAARLVNEGRDGSDSPGEDRRKLNEAKEKALGAWQYLDDADIGTVHRVLGVVELTRNDYGHAAVWFAKAIEAFKGAGQESTLWCAVAH